MSRFPKLTPEQMTPAQREVAAEIAAGPRGEVRGPFIALIHNAELARRIQSLGEHLRWKTKLPPKLVELAVLVTARRWTCQHEWFVHSELARKAGLDEQLIAAIRDGREPTLQRTDVDAVNGCTGSHVLQRRFDAVRPHVVDERCRRLADAQQRGAGDAGLVRDGAHAGTRSVATV